MSERPDFYLPPSRPGEPDTPGPRQGQTQPRTEPARPWQEPAPARHYGRIVTESPQYRHPPQGWSGQQNMPGGPVPRRRGIRWWVWVIIALALIPLLAVAVFAMALLSAMGPTKAPDWTAVPHANEGAFLTPSYADGAREFAVDSRGSVDFVGASLDGGVVAINVDNEVRGIDIGTTETVWTYPSVACSEGTYDGVALCIDEGRPGALFLSDVPDMIGLDLATGEPTFRFTPEDMPFDSDIEFVGSDEVHGYFTWSRFADGDAISQGNMMAVTPKGEVAWMTALPPDTRIKSAALVANDRIAVGFIKRVMMIDRFSGTIEVDLEVGSSGPVTFLWDGWTYYQSGGDKTMRAFDQNGDPVGEFSGFNSFIPSDGHPNTVGVPVYELQALIQTDTYLQYPWGVTRDGELVLQSFRSGISNRSGKVVVEDTRLRGLSGDGSLFLSDEVSGAVHDGETGELIGGFTQEHNTLPPIITDGIVTQSVNTPEHEATIVLLPGAAEG